MVPGPMVPEVHPKALLEPTPLPKQQASSKPMPVPRSPGRGARKNGFRTDGARSAPRGTSPTDLLSAATILFKTDVGFQVIRKGGRRKQLANRFGKHGFPMGPCTAPHSEETGLFQADVGSQVTRQGGEENSLPTDWAKMIPQSGPAPTPFVKNRVCSKPMQAFKE